MRFSADTARLRRALPAAVLFLAPLALPAGEPYPNPLTTDMLDGTLGFVYEGRQGTQAGHVVAGAGDVNGDGFDDALISAPHRVSGVDTTDGVTLLFGGPGPFPALLKLEDLDGTNGIHFYHSEMGLDGITGGYGVGDINGDGFSDFSYSGQGSTHIIFGRPDFPQQSHIDLDDYPPAQQIVIFKGNTNSLFHGVAAHPGDVNDDGRDDFALLDIGSGALLFLTGRGDWPEEIDLFSFPLDGETSWAVQGVPNASITNTIGFVSYLGDINGDGFDDVGYGMPLGALPGGGDNEGGVTVVFGGEEAREPSVHLFFEPDISVGYIIAGETDDAATGAGLTGLGDLDGDGIGEFGFGAPLWNPDSENGLPPGRCYLVRGHEPQSPFLNLVNHSDFVSRITGAQPGLTVAPVAAVVDRLMNGARRSSPNSLFLAGEVQEFRDIEFPGEVFFETGNPARQSYHSVESSTFFGASLSNAAHFEGGAYETFMASFNSGTVGSLPDRVAFIYRFPDEPETRVFREKNRFCPAPGPSAILPGECNRRLPARSGSGG